MHTRIGERSLSPSTINRWLNASAKINLTLPDKPTPEPYWQRHERRQRRIDAAWIAVLLLLVAGIWYKALT
jgi:hypothetical protein